MPLYRCVIISKMFNTWIIVLVYGRFFFFYIFFYTICFPFFSCLFFLVSSTIVTLLYWKYMYCYFKNSHLLQYIALILNMLIKQFFNRVIDEQYCIVHLQKYACVVLLILDTNDLIMCDSVYFSMIWMNHEVL